MNISISLIDIPNQLAWKNHDDILIAKLAYLHIKPPVKLN
jgi:hypothetical protein